MPPRQFAIQFIISHLRETFGLFQERADRSLVSEHFTSFACGKEFRHYFH
jgi:hypothetical protein